MDCQDCEAIWWCQPWLTKPYWSLFVRGIICHTGGTLLMALGCNPPNQPGVYPSRNDIIHGHIYICIYTLNCRYRYRYVDKSFLTLDHFFNLTSFFRPWITFFDLGSLFLDLDLLFLNLGMFLFNLGLLSHTCLEPCAILHFFSVCVWFWSV